MTTAHRGPRLLIRDLEQIASPAATSVPARGRELSEVTVLQHGYVLCEGERITAVGSMRQLERLDGEVEELDGRGLCAIPGLVDCHTHPAFGGNRVQEFALRAGGASYEELHAAGGAATWLGAHAVPPEFEGGDAYLDYALAEVLPEASMLAGAADVFLERGAFDAAQARRYLSACRDAGLALRLHGDQFTESGAIPLAVELGARSVDHLEATGPEGVRALAASSVTGVLLPASALFLGRPMPPARALVDAGAAVALAPDFNPGSAFCESLPLVCSLAATQLRLSPAEALTACTVNAAHVLGRSDRVGRLAPGYLADCVLLGAPDWRYLAYHLGGQEVEAVVLRGEVAALG